MHSRNDNFTYPVLFGFGEINFIMPIRFLMIGCSQTFLLDKDNKIIALGNPIHNSKIKDLFLNIISGGTSLPDEKRPQTEVKIEALSMDLGMFDWKKEQKCILPLRIREKSCL